MRNEYEWPWVGQVWDSGDGIKHRLQVLSGGYLMDDEIEVACTRYRLGERDKTSEGAPNCVLCAMTS